MLANSAVTCLETEWKRSLLAFGGWNSKKTLSVASFLEFDPTLKAWTPVANAQNVPPARSEHTMNAIKGGPVVLFGGWDDRKILGDTWVMTWVKDAPPTWVEATNPAVPGPCPRRGHATAVLGDKVYLFGGFDGEKRLDDIWVFDISTRTWLPLRCTGNAPTARDATSLCAVPPSNSLIVFGGYSTAKLDDVYILDVGSLTWSRFHRDKTTPSPRCGHSMVYVAFLNCVWLFGGSDESGGNPDGVLSFNVAEGTWSAAVLEGEHVEGRTHQSATYLDTDKKVVSLGGFNGKAYLHSYLEIEVEKQPEAVPVKGAKK